MNSVNSAIAELEAKRAQIDDAITVLRAVDSGAAPVVLRSVPSGKVKGVRKPTNGKRKLIRATAETWVEARKLYESGVGAETIAKQLHVTSAALYWHAANEKPRWNRPKSVAATGEKLSASVRCPSCQIWTDRDPCTNCGKKVRR